MNLEKPLYESADNQTIKEDAEIAAELIKQIPTEKNELINTLNKFFRERARQKGRKQREEEGLMKSELEQKIKKMENPSAIYRQDIAYHDLRFEIELIKELRGVIESLMDTSVNIYLNLLINEYISAFLHDMEDEKLRKQLKK